MAVTLAHSSSFFQNNEKVLEKLKIFTSLAMLKAAAVRKS